MGRHPRWVRRFLTEIELDAVTAAVRAAEAGTSAEVRIHLDAACPGDPMTRAVAVFERLGMHRTGHRNGVLVYLAVTNRKCAVIGDAGIHGRAVAEYWHGLSTTLIRHCRDGRPGAGLVAVLREVGELLRRHFPRDPEDRNELPDEVSLG